MGVAAKESSGIELGSSVFLAGIVDETQGSSKTTNANPTPLPCTMDEHALHKTEPWRKHVQRSSSS